MKRAGILLGVATIFALALSTSAWAEEPEDVANRISGEVMSPYCPGVTLHDCPSDAALEKREEIEGWARAGWSEDRIMAQLEEDFGDNIRANPSGTKGLWAWAIPAVVLAAGVFAATSLSKRWSGSADDAEVHVTPEERRRVEADLQILRREHLR